MLLTLQSTRLGTPPYISWVAGLELYLFVSYYCYCCALALELMAAAPTRSAVLMS